MRIRFPRFLSLAAVVLASALAAPGLAGDTGPAPIPPEKAALLEAEASFAAMNPTRQAAAKDLAAAPVISQAAEPPLIGLVALDAPFSSSEFTPNGNAYLAIEDGAWIRVYVGAPIDRPTESRVLVLSTPMKGKAVEPGAMTDAVFLVPPIGGGPLVIDGVDAKGRVVIRNPAGQAVPFDLVTRTFGG